MDPFKKMKEEMREIDKKMKSMHRRVAAIPRQLMRPDSGRGRTDGSYSVARSQVYVERSGTGREPRVYKESTVARAGPGGVKEVKREVYDSTRGRAVTDARTLRDQGLVRTRALDTRGELVEDHQDLYNLNDEERELSRFHEEWEQHRDRYLPPGGDQSGNYLTKK